MTNFFQDKIPFNKKIFLFAAAIIMIGGFFVVANQALAIGPAVVYVDSTFTDDASCAAIAGPDSLMDTDCFTTIQAGIAAVADGGTVNVAAGIYTEQITINKSLDLIGAGESNTTILAPAIRTNSVTRSTNRGVEINDYVVAAYAPSSTIDVRIQGFTIDANGQNKTSGTTRFDGVFFGDVLDAGGTVAGLFSSTIQNFGSATNNSGIMVEGNSTLTVDDNAISNYTSFGIDADGDNGLATDPNVTIHNNVLTGSSAGYGILVFGGGVATIKGNNISGNTRTPSPGYGILISNSNNVTIGGTGSGDANQIHNNFIGIELDIANHTTIVGNTLTDNVDRAAQLYDADNNTVSGNTITGPSGGTDVAGVGLSGGSTLNTIGGNTSADENTITMATSGTGLLYAIYMQSDVAAGSNTIRYNTITGGQRAVQFDGPPGTTGTTTISNNTISDQGFGGIMAYNNGDITISDNIFTNTVRPIEFYGPVNVSITGNTINGSTYAGINLGAFSGTATVEHNTIFNVPAGNHGISANASGAGLSIHGNTIYNIGERGIQVNSAATNANIDGNEIYGVAGYAGIVIDGGATGAKINNNYVHDNTAGGMAINAQTSEIKNNRILNNDFGIDAGAAGATFVLQNNSIAGNDAAGAACANPKYGVCSSGLSVYNGTADATNNWWGAASGPGSVGSGSGDKVSTNITYNPWYNTDAKTTKTYQVGAGETYTAIQSAINAASTTASDTIKVAAGAYSENMNVNKALTLTGVASTTVIVSAAVSNVSVFNVTASSVNISGFTVTGASVSTTAGIYLGNDVAHCNVSNNILTGNGDGIWLGSGSNNNTLENNTLSGNYQGFEVYHSDYNTFANNIASSNNVYGFKMESADHNIFTGNTASSNAKYGFYLSAGSSNSDNNTFTSNIANSNTEYGIRINSSDGNTLTNNTFNLNVIAGIRLKDDVINLTLNGNSFTNSPTGIDIASGVGSVTSWTLSNNKITENTTYSVSNLGTGTLNAANNYWGTDYPVFSSIISGDVNHDPWYFDPDMTQSSSQIATIFQGIATTLSGNGIASNIGDATASNFKSFPDLYFEKSISGIKVGKITFNDPLDLSSDETTTFLQNLGSKMDANTAGTIGLDFRNTTSDLSLKDVSATIKFYGLDTLGFTNQTTSAEINSKLVAFSDDGNTIATSTLITAPGTYTPPVGICEVGGDCYIFTISVNHFTKYKIDNTPPANATFSPNKTVATNTDVLVTINFPSDATVKQYKVNNGDWQSYSGAVTMTQNGTVSAKSSDLVGNWSEVTQYEVTNIDKTSLAPSNLSVGSETANSLTLNWTNNESNGSYYTIKRSTNIITEANFNDATSLSNIPSPASGSQNYVAKNLTADATYYFAIKLTDNLGNVSSISTASKKTLAASVSSSDTTAPSAISDLAAQAGTTATSQIKLTWAATGDDGATGIATKYIIKRSSAAITAGNFDAATTVFNSLTPQSAGSAETFTVTGLIADTTYYFAIKAQDEANNASAISNVADRTTSADLPTIVSINISSGQNDSAVAITISGTNFVTSTSTLRFSNSQNTFGLAAAYVSAASLTATIPVGAPVGVYSLKVVNSNGISAALASAYEVMAAPTPPPSVSDITPSTIGTNDSIISLTITGTNFTGTTGVSINGVALDSVIVVNTAKITATLSGIATEGSYDVRVTTPNGTNTMSSVKLNVKAPVVIDSNLTQDQTTSQPINLDTGNIPVQITMQSDDTIVNSDTVGTIEVVIPPATEVKGADGNAYTGNINPPQLVKPTDEITAKAGAGAVVITMGNSEETITFSNDFVTTVTLETTSTKAPLIWYYKANSTLELAGKAGAKDGVTYAVGGTVLNTVNNGSIYTYTIGLLMDHMSSYVAGVTPTISNISPSSLRAGYAITISGTNFSPTNKVKFGGTEVSAVSNNSASISVVVPVLNPMNYNITVVNSDGLISNAYDFTVESTGGTVINPNSGSSAGPSTPATPAPTAAQVTPQVLGEKIYANSQLEQILTDTTAVWSENIDTILANIKAARDTNAEQTTSDKYLSNLTHNEKDFSSADANRLNWFVTYGTVGTKILGAGERAGVINSYKSAFGKLPKTESEWQDAIKIANGRWPSVKNSAAETKAKASFKKIYGREAKMDNANDNAAVTVMAYGLRPSLRNLNSEKAAILAFKYFIKRAPSTAADWDMVRATAYSGAKR